MRTLRLIVLGAAVFLSLQMRAPASHDRTASLTIQASFATRTLLRVSSSELRFDVPDSGSAEATVDFWAGARTGHDGAVVLTVQPAGDIQGPTSGPGASSAQNVVISYRNLPDSSSDASGVLSGQSIAGRWVGSGVRQGRMVFTLTGAGRAGVYVVPLKFVLSAQ